MSASCLHCGAALSEDDRFCRACGTKADVPGASGQDGDALIGRTVAGSYLVQSLLGVGGMGRVYRATQATLGRTVALKVIHPHLLSDSQTVARFYNEAKAASRLNHPSSVSIYDFGRTDDGILYLAMEFLTGKDLAVVLSEEGPLPLRRITRIVRHALQGLGEAHALGVIHRDLKPENILLTRSRRGDESVKVVDFGLATILGRERSSITLPGLVCGTPDYMSPEQGRGDPLDGRADLYSAGVLLFEMLTDRLPYVDDTPTKVVMRHIGDPIPDPRVIAPHRNIPAVLAELTIKALAKDAAHRFQSADEMEEALRHTEEVLGVRETTTRCGACSAVNPPNSKFCNDCGTKLAVELTSKIPPKLSMMPPPLQATLAGQKSAFRGRQRELETLLSARDAAFDAPRWVRLVGENGAGKSRLLGEFLQLTAAKGHATAQAGPHPSGTPVHYHAIAELTAQLLAVPASELRSWADKTHFADPIAHAGILEMCEPKGLEYGATHQGATHTSRASAVAVALLTACDVAQARAPHGPVLLAIEDVGRCDGLTLMVVQRAIAQATVQGKSLLIVTSDVALDTMPQEAAAGAAAVRPQIVPLRVGPLPAKEADLMFERDSPFSGRETGVYLPLAAVLCRTLRQNVDEQENATVGDLAHQLLARLDGGSRKTLQAASVLGDRFAHSLLASMHPQATLENIEKLEKLELVMLSGEDVAFTHPFLREMALNSIPAEARKELHAKALGMLVNAPLSVRAEHAYRAGDSFAALLLLEQLGKQMLAVGDSDGAAVAFRRGLEVARRELFLSGDAAVGKLELTFARQLGEALLGSGDLSQADGVLREAVEVSQPGSLERSRMHVLLGRVAEARERKREAARFFGQAVEEATRAGDPRTEAQAQVLLASLRRDEGDTLSAANTARRAVELLTPLEGSRAALISAEMEYVDCLIGLEDHELATQHSEFAITRAESEMVPMLLCRAWTQRAELLELRGDRERALLAYRNAHAHAATAGHVEWADRLAMAQAS